MRDLSALERRLLNDYQRGFPLVSRPYGLIGETLQVGEACVMERLRSLQAMGTISRIGPVFSPGAIGCSLLAALAVPAERLEEVAGWISTFPEVNHNYAREHHFNLWFVVTAPDQDSLQTLLDSFRDQTGCELLALPLIEQFHIDLGFDLFGQSVTKTKAPQRGSRATVALDAWQRGLVQRLQGGLAISQRPFAQLSPGGVCDVSGEARALEQIASWCDEGVIKRFGVVVRHHELGYRDNAMVVWDVPDQVVSRYGASAAHHPAVTLCYRRPRQSPSWPYNLFCMIHGKDRMAVHAAISDLCASSGLSQFPVQVLFSTRRFKQCGARYVVNG